MENTILVIDEKEKENAKALTQSFTKADIRTRAYINALGSEVCLKYLRDEEIVSGDIYNMHNVRKILEEFDISDIMLSNIHLDVRVIYDENQIFIPKSHFEYDITPDIYIVLKMSKDGSQTEFLGFFEPKMINKNNANDKYYFIEKEKLSAAVDLKNYINNFSGRSDREYNEQDIENAEYLMLSMTDNDISDEDKKKIFDYLKNSGALRDKFIEFENFEMISYQTANSEEFMNQHSDDVVEELSMGSESVEENFDNLVSESSEDISISEDLTEEINLQDSIGENILEPDMDISGDVLSETPMDLSSEDNIGIEEPSVTENVGQNEASIDDMLKGAAVMGAEIAGAAVASAALSGVGEGAELAKDIADSVDNVAGVADALSENNNPDDNLEIQDYSKKSNNEMSLDDALSSLLESNSPMPSLSFNDSFGNDVSYESDDIVFSNDDDYDDLIFENNDEYDENFGESSGKAYLPPTSTSKPAISTVVNTPISEATDLISMESLTIANDDNKLASQSDAPDMMEMDEFKNLVDNYVPQDVKDESVCIDFNAIDKADEIFEENKELNSNVIETDEDEITSDAFVEEMPEEMVQKTFSAEDEITSDAFVEEMPEEVVQKTFSAEDEITSDAFVEEMPKEVVQKTFSAEDEITSDAFVEEMPEETVQKTFSAEDNISSDDFVEDMPLGAEENLSDSQIDNKLVQDEVSSEELVNNLSDDVVSGVVDKNEELAGDVNFQEKMAVDIDEFSTGLEQISEESLTVDDSSLNIMENIPNITENITGELNDELAINDNIGDSIELQDIPSEVNIEEQKLVGSDTNEVQNSSEAESIANAEFSDISDLSLLDEFSDLSEENSNDSLNLQSSESDKDLNVQSENEFVNQNQNIEGNIDTNLELQTGLNEDDIEICEDENTNNENFDSISDIESVDFESSETSDDDQDATLEVLYGDSENGAVEDSLISDDDVYDYRPKKSSSKLIPIFGFLTLVVIVGAVVGFMIKSKNSVESETLISSTPENGTLASPETDNSGILADENQIESAIPTEDAVLEPSAQAPKAVQPTAPIEVSKEVKQEAVKNTKEAIKSTKNEIEKQKAEASAPKKPINASKTVTLQKISWEVPDYLSYSDNMRKYLQTAGKSIKLTLSSDLLLTNEYIYSNQVKVSLKLSKDGTIQDAKVVRSSGSNQVDGIVLQTVKSTLNAVKPAQGEVPTPNFNLGIIIYL